MKKKKWEKQRENSQLYESDNGTNIHLHKTPSSEFKVEQVRQLVSDIFIIAKKPGRPKLR